MESDQTLVRMTQEFATLKIFVCDERDRFRTFALESAEILGLVSGQIVRIDSQQETVTSRGIIVVVASNLTICRLDLRVKKSE